MINVSKVELKKNTLPTITAGMINTEQARIIAQIIYHLLQADADEPNNTNVA